MTKPCLPADWWKWDSSRWNFEHPVFFTPHLLQVSHLGVLGRNGQKDKLCLDARWETARLTFYIVGKLRLLWEFKPLKLSRWVQIRSIRAQRIPKSLLLDLTLWDLNDDKCMTVAWYTTRYRENLLDLGLLKVACCSSSDFDASTPYLSWW
jgi:hypothetical protein